MKKKVKDISDPFADDLANFSKIANALRSNPIETRSAVRTSSAEAVKSMLSTSLGGASSMEKQAPPISLDGLPMAGGARRRPAESSVDVVVSAEGRRSGSLTGRRGGEVPAGAVLPISGVPLSLSSIGPSAPSSVGTGLLGRRGGGQGKPSLGEAREAGGLSPFPTGAGSSSPAFLSSHDTSTLPIHHAASAPLLPWETSLPPPPDRAPLHPTTVPPAPAADLPWLSDPSARTPPATAVHLSAGSASSGGTKNASAHPSLHSIQMAADDTSLPFFLQDEKHTNPFGDGKHSGSETVLRDKPLSSVLEEPPSIPPWVAEKNKLKEQQKELYSDLEAVELEIEMLDKQMGLQQIKDETELLQLDTDLMIAQDKLLREAEEVKTKVKENKELEEERMNSSIDRNEKELEKLREEVVSGERSKYQLRLSRLQEELENVQRSVTLLQNQKELLSFRHPYDKRTILAGLALDGNNEDESHQSRSSSPKESLVPISKVDKEQREVDRTHRSEGEGEKIEDVDAQQRVQSHVSKGLAVIKAYCDAYCRNLRSEIIDVIHRETEQAAHKVRQVRESSWVYEAMDRKARLAAYKAQSLEDYLTFFRHRGDLKVKTIKHIHAMIQSQCEQLRLTTRERLSQAVSQVEAKIQFQQADYEKKVQESFLLQKEREGRNNGMDKESRQAKLEELRTRRHTELVIRKKIFLAERETLEKQYRSAMCNHTQQRSSSFSKIQDQAKTNARESIRNIQADLLEFKSNLEDQFSHYKENKRIDIFSSPKALSAKMKVDEAKEVVRAVEHVTKNTQDQCAIKTKRVEELCSQVTSVLSRVIELLRDKRVLQHSQEQELSFLHKLWEREHRKALESPHPLEPPSIASNSSGLGCTQDDWMERAEVTVPSVYADPTRVTVASYLKKIIGNLGAFLERHKALRKERNQLRHSPNELMNSMRQQHLRVNQAWASVLEAILQLQDILDAKTKHDAIMIVQQERVRQEMLALDSEQEELLAQKKMLEFRSSQKEN